MSSTTKKSWFRRNWKIVFGLFFIAGGIGNFGSDWEAALFGIVTGSVLLFWHFSPQLLELFKANQKRKAELRTKAEEEVRIQEQIRKAQLAREAQVSRCRYCGANTRGSVCEYCGSRTER